MVKVKTGIEVYVNIQTADALSAEFNDKWSIECTADIRKLKVEPKVTVLGEEPESNFLCECQKPANYILQTNFLTIESPLSCFKCFGTVPLYKIPRKSELNVQDIVIWQSNYQACDTLFMNSGPGERFGTNQMSKFDSPLTKQGLEVCAAIQKATGKKVFYYLHKYYAKSQEDELQRKCPGCNGNWLLKKPFRFFDFMCKKCKLLSSIGFDVRG